MTSKKIQPGILFLACSILARLGHDLEESLGLLNRTSSAETDRDMLLIPEGAYQIGEQNNFENQYQELEIKPYLVNKNYVSKNEFSIFLDRWGLFEYEHQKTEGPFAKVTWVEAFLFSLWSGKRLLWEAEWEVIAANPDLSSTCGIDGNSWEWVYDSYEAQNIAKPESVQTLTPFNDMKVRRGGIPTHEKPSLYKRQFSPSYSKTEKYQFRCARNL